MNQGKAVVCSLKLKNGDNILGYFVGEQENAITNELSLNVFKPIRMIVTTNTYPNGSICTNYVPQFFAPFGSPIVLFAMTDILHYDIASPFYSRLYSKVLGEMIVYEEEREARINKAFDAQELKDLLSKTDSIYINQSSDYLQ